MTLASSLWARLLWTLLQNATQLLRTASALCIIVVRHYNFEKENEATISAMYLSAGCSQHAKCSGRYRSRLAFWGPGSVAIRKDTLYLP